MPAKPKPKRLGRPAKQAGAKHYTIYLSAADWEIIESLGDNRSEGIRALLHHYRTGTRPAF
jgi:hypothetical protein